MRRCASKKNKKDLPGPAASRSKPRPIDQLLTPAKINFLLRKLEI